MDSVEIDTRLGREHYALVDTSVNALQEKEIEQKKRKKTVAAPLVRWPTHLPSSPPPKQTARPMLAEHNHEDGPTDSKRASSEGVGQQRRSFLLPPCPPLALVVYLHALKAGGERHWVNVTLQAPPETAVRSAAEDGLELWDLLQLGQFRLKYPEEEDGSHVTGVTRACEETKGRELVAQ